MSRGAFGDSYVPQVTPLLSAEECHCIVPHEEAPLEAAADISCVEVRASPSWNPLHHQLHECLNPWIATLAH